MTDLNALVPDEQVVQLEKLARNALPAFGFDKRSQLALLAYRENAVFKVREPAAQEAWVIRIHRENYHSRLAITSELRWMRALNEAGILAPRNRLTITGDAVATIETGLGEERFASALEWVDGTPPEPLVLTQTFATLGKLSARIHNHGASWHAPSDFSRWHLDDQSMFGPKGIWGNFEELEKLLPHQLALLRRAAEAVRAALNSFGQSRDRFGLIHGDLMPENILVDGDDVRVIDFDDCAFSWYLYDLATGLFPHLGEPYFDELVGVWVENYRSVRPLPDEHLLALPALIMARLLLFAGWAAARKDHPIAIAQTDELIAGACDFAEYFLGQPMPTEG